MLLFAIVNVLSLLFILFFSLLNIFILFLSLTYRFYYFNRFLVLLLLFISFPLINTFIWVIFFCPFSLWFLMHKVYISRGVKRRISHSSQWNEQHSFCEQLINGFLIFFYRQKFVFNLIFSFNYYWLIFSLPHYWESSTPLSLFDIFFLFFCPLNQLILFFSLTKQWRLRCTSTKMSILPLKNHYLFNII